MMRQHTGMTAEEYFGGVDPWATTPEPVNPEDKGWDDQRKVLDHLEVPAFLPNEVWIRARGVEGYQVSTAGRIRSLPGNRRRGRVLRGKANKGGYLTVVIEGRTMYVHHLVAEAFFGTRPEGMETRHLNGDKSDNRVANLRFGSKSENMLDAVAHGTHVNTRKTHCPQGHPYEGLNLIRSSGRRRCRTCKNARSAA